MWNIDYLMISTYLTQHGCLQGSWANFSLQPFSIPEDVQVHTFLYEHTYIHSATLRNSWNAVRAYFKL